MRRDPIPVVVAGAACAACCAGPILGAIGISIGVAAVAWLAVGFMGLVVVVLARTLVVRRRRAAPA
jgi:hypothetical protein